MYAIDPIRNRRGIVLVHVAALLVAILGMTALVIDIGRLYIAKQKAQNVCDLAVFAGGALLSGKNDPTVIAKADTAARDCAMANNESSTAWKVVLPGCSADDPTEGVTVTFPSGTFTDDSGNVFTVTTGEAIRAQGSIHVDALFAVLFGERFSTVSTSSMAIFKAVDTFTGQPIIPLCVSDKIVFGDSANGIPPLQFGVEQALHLTSAKTGFLGPGNYLSLSLDGDRGASDYRDRLSGDVQTDLDPNVPVYTEPGYKGNSTYNGISERLARETDPRFVANNPDAWENWLAAYDTETQMFPDTDRIVLVPIIRDTVDAVSGRKIVEVVGMAGFFIDKIYDGSDGIHKSGDLEGRFLQGVATGDTIRWQFPDGSTPTEPPQIERMHIVS